MAADNRFRRQLVKVLDVWVDESLITAEQRERLREYYHLDRLKREADGRFTTVLLAIGAILVGLGTISFVAANWERISPSLRAIGVLMLMLGFDFSGYWLWRGAGGSQGFRRLGSALLLIGQLMLGASIGLMAQWVQVTGSPAGLFLWWGLGVLGVAYTVRHNFSGVLAIVLLQSAYISSLQEPLHIPWLDGVLAYMPLLTLAIFLPLAYWCRSRWLFAATVLAIDISTVAAVFGETNVSSDATAYWYWLAYFALTSGWWAFSFVHQRALPQLDRWLPADTDLEQEFLQGSSNSDRMLGRHLDRGLDFAPFARILSVLGLLGGLSVLSFDDARYFWYDGRMWANFGEVFQSSPLLTAIVWGFLVLAIAMWVLNLRDRSLEPQRPTATNRLDTAIGLTSLIAVLLLHAGALWGFTTLLFNLLLFGLACTLAWSGLQLGIRWRYWMGLLAVTLQILSRFFEYDTGLLLKSLVLIICGIGTIAAGLSFERSLKQSPPTAPSS